MNLAPLIRWLLILFATGPGMLLPAHACSLQPGLSEEIPYLILPRAKASSWEQESYYHGLLHLILTRTEKEFGPCRIDQTDEVLTRLRSAVLIDRQQGVDLLWGTATIEREKMLRSIPIPLLKGLMKHKILLIHPDDQEKFSAIHNAEQLQQLRAGLGSDWPDVTVLRNSDIPVVTSSNYEALYKMLAARRFDFLPRGANQILSEVRHNADMHILVEKDLVLIYPAPVYFYVSHDNEALARRIETGLRSMIADGTFDKYFYKHPMVIEVMESLNLKGRRPIYLHNPLLPEGADPEEDDQWLSDEVKAH